MSKRTEKMAKARAKKKAQKAAAMKEPGFKSRYQQRESGARWVDASEHELLARTRRESGSTSLFRNGEPV